LMQGSMSGSPIGDRRARETTVVQRFVGRWVPRGEIS
jgi:hypothetical protein